MTATSGIGGIEATDLRARALVWIDAREAVVVRMQGDRTRIDRVASDVPPHRRATGHVRHEPDIRHGGGGSPQTAGEPRRLEHLKRFVADVANRLALEDDLVILGPGTVHERLARYLAESDEHRGRHRLMACEVSPRLTDRQLIARLQRFAGIEPRRHTVGAYRWSQPAARRPSGQADPLPSHMVEKPPRRRGPEARGG